MNCLKISSYDADADDDSNKTEFKVVYILITLFPLNSLQIRVLNHRRIGPSQPPPVCSHRGRTSVPGNS